MSKIAATAKVHPFAVVEDGAEIGPDSVIGPFCHVGGKVVLGANVELISHVVVIGKTSVGDGTRIFPSAVIGGDSQSAKHSAIDTTLVIGRNCTIREGVTMNTGTIENGGTTTVGDNGLFLAYSHIAHDCRVGNNVIMSNNVMLAGHVTLGDHCIVSGGAAVHQFTRIGHHAFIGGLSAVSYDVIPFGMLNGNPGLLEGLNIVGMSRSGVERSVMHRVRRAYKAIFEGPASVRENAMAIREEYADCKEVMDILDFIAADSDRALSSPARRRKT
jgi:UDP-N-acetylglucosamine acyltransferase